MDTTVLQTKEIFPLRFIYELEFEFELTIDIFCRIIDNCILFVSIDIHNIEKQIVLRV
jgi:hypothetical protein